MKEIYVNDYKRYYKTEICGDYCVRDSLNTEFMIVCHSNRICLKVIDLLNEDDKLSSESDKALYGG